jgi:hypothetical protein
MTTNSPSAILQQVATYQASDLAYLINLNCFITTANTKFKNFEDEIGNLGDTVTFDRPPRYTTSNGLVITTQTSVQRVQTLVVNNAQNVAYNFTSQQILFNVEEYWDKFAKSAVEELAANVEASVANVCVTNTFRFYGDGVTPITTFNQLAKMLAFFRNFGAAKNNTHGYLSDIAVPDIVGSGLNQFAVKRNDETAMSWEIGAFSRCEWYQSNLLPVHIAGTVGNSAIELTVVSTTKNAAGEITNILFSQGSANTNDASAVLQYDKFQFEDNVTGKTNLRFLTFVGHLQSNSPVQFAAEEIAASDATGNGQINVKLYPPLLPGAVQASSSDTMNINVDIIAGMKATVLPSHRAGMVNSGEPLFLAMPTLPTQEPFYSASEYDDDTGVSMRCYWGTVLGQNQQIMAHDCIWGYTMVPEYAMSVIFPL